MVDEVLDVEFHSVVAVCSTVDVEYDVQLLLDE